MEEATASLTPSNGQEQSPAGSGVSGKASLFFQDRCSIEQNRLRCFPLWSVARAPMVPCSILTWRASFPFSSPSFLSAMLSAVIPYPEYMERGMTIWQVSYLSPKSSGQNISWGFKAAEDGSKIGSELAPGCTQCLLDARKQALPHWVTCWRSCWLVPHRAPFK